MLNKIPGCTGIVAPLIIRFSLVQLTRQPDRVYNGLAWLIQSLSYLRPISVGHDSRPCTWIWWRAQNISYSHFQGPISCKDFQEQTDDIISNLSPMIRDTMIKIERRQHVSSSNHMYIFLTHHLSKV